jgi:hypothetical protein
MLVIKETANKSAFEAIKKLEKFFAHNYELQLPEIDERKQRAAIFELYSASSL